MIVATERISNDIDEPVGMVGLRIIHIDISPAEIVVNYWFRGHYQDYKQAHSELN